MHQNESSFTPCVLTKDLSVWTVSEANSDLFTVSNIDKIVADIVISICFWRDRSQRDQVSSH